MKTLILHLSDLHLNQPRGKIDTIPLVQACSCGPKPDNVVLVFSGDFVNVPTEQNYAAFIALFADLKESLQEKLDQVNIETIMVPGNHDINLTKCKQITQAKIRDNISMREQYFTEELSAEEDALKICSDNGCEFLDGAIGEKTIFFGNLAIHFVLVNSAPFSSLRYDDKEHHYLPSASRLMGGPVSNKKTIEVLVSHHRADWFEYGSSVKINEFIADTASICLYGHEHDAKCFSQVSNEENVIVSKGGELCILNNVVSGSFSKILIDEESETVDAEVQTFNTKFRAFKPAKCYSFRIRFNDPRKLKASFDNEILNPVVTDHIREKDVFVMPLLRSNGEQDDISSLSDLVDYSLTEGNVYLHGFHNCGKSSLLHRLFEEIRKQVWAVFLQCEDGFTSNPEKSIRIAYEQEYYYSDLNYEDFVRAPKEEKVIIVDSFEELRSETIRTKYLEYFNEKFGSVIIAVPNSTFNAKTIFSNSNFDPNHSFEISGFSMSKRKELYSNIAKKHDIDLEADIDLIFNTIESALSLGSVVDTSDPGFLVEIASDIIKDKFYLERDTKNGFSEAFQHSINTALLSVVSAKFLDDYYSLLSQLAADMAFIHKSRCFDAVQLQNAMNERKKKFEIKFQPFDEVLRNLLSSGIIVAEKDKYRFERNSLHSFFAAKEVVRLYQKGDTKYLDAATEDITYGIYGDIVMFAAYQLQRVDVFFKMQDILSKSLEGVPELSYDKKNNPILEKNTQLIPETEQQAETRKQFYDRLDKGEKKAIADAPKTESQVFEEKADNTWVNSITKALKLLEISSKAISGFKTEIEAGDREVLLDATVSSALRLINFMYFFTPEDIDNIERDFGKWKASRIEKMKEEKKPQKAIEKMENETITHVFYDYLTTMVLNVLTGMANIMTSKTSLPFIDKLDDSDSFRKLFILIAYSESGSNKRFLSYFTDLMNSAKDLGFQLILKRVARVFAITHTLSVAELDRLAIACGYKRDKFYLFTKPAEKK